MVAETGCRKAVVIPVLAILKAAEQLQVRPQVVLKIGAKAGDRVG